MHLVRVGAVCAMLDDVHHVDGGHLFIVKGGTAMQLRLGIQARATTDLDTIFRDRADEWLTAFDRATVNKIWNGSTVVRKTEPKQIEIPGLGYRPWRVALQLRYEGTEFGTTSFEVAIDEQTASHCDLVETDSIPLGKFAIEQPGLIPCLDVPFQIAHKMHACSEPIDGGNDRVRDIVDIWLVIKVDE